MTVGGRRKEAETTAVPSPLRPADARPALLPLPSDARHNGSRVRIAAGSSVTQHVRRHRWHASLGRRVFHKLIVLLQRGQTTISPGASLGRRSTKGHDELMDGLRGVVGPDRDGVVLHPRRGDGVLGRWEEDNRPMARVRDVEAEQCVWPHVAVDVHAHRRRRHGAGRRTCHLTGLMRDRPATRPKTGPHNARVQDFVGDSTRPQHSMVCTCSWRITILRRRKGCKRQCNNPVREPPGSSPPRTDDPRTCAAVALMSRARSLTSIGSGLHQPLCSERRPSRRKAAPQRRIPPPG